MNSHIFLVGFIIYAIAMIWLGGLCLVIRKAEKIFCWAGRSFAAVSDAGSLNRCHDGWHGFQYGRRGLWLQQWLGRNGLYGVGGAVGILLVAWLFCTGT